MPLLGQSSGGWTESSSALRILHVGIRNTVGVLTDDAFTQTNPPIVTTAATVSTNVNTAVLGVLSGSVAFTRPDVGSNYIGGPIANTGSALNKSLTRVLGLFINTAVGNAYENTPGPASGKGPYVSGMGTYASQLFETQALGIAQGYAANEDLVYTTGMPLMASRNGYLMPAVDDVGVGIADDVDVSAEAYWAVIYPTNFLAILKMPADSVQPEIVFDLRV
jgi:hypothetical protein